MCSGYGFLLGAEQFRVQQSCLAARVQLVYQCRECLVHTDCLHDLFLHMVRAMKQPRSGVLRTQKLTPQGYQQFPFSEPGVGI